MSSFFSPDPEGSKSPESEQSSNAHSEGSSSRLSLGFFKIGSRSKDSDSQKKRGPKPDANPPQTERQARNRQAQRTHRERKERYVKSLEEEVMRLREAFATVTKEKTVISDENRQLRQILLNHGVDVSFLDSEQSQSQRVYQVQMEAQPSAQQPQGNPNTVGGGAGGRLNYSELGIQFCLALEAPCIEHIQVLTNNAAENSDFVHGHAMMTSCPPESHSLNHPTVEWGQKTIDLPVDDLAILFNMQMLEMQRQKFIESLDGELTPIAAWAMITTHPRFLELILQDFAILRDVLGSKARCYGFGAVIEEFEVRDAVASVFARKNIAFH